MLLIRASARRQQEEASPSAVSSWVASDAETAAIASLRATLAAGNPLSVNQLSSRFNLTRQAATRERDRVLAEANGHDPGDSPPDP